MERKRMAQLKPLVIGRVTRVLFGIATFILIPVIGVATLTFWGVAALILLGLSFVVGGIVGNPGCELTALPNLLLPKMKRVHCL